MRAVRSWCTSTAAHSWSVLAQCRCSTAPPWPGAATWWSSPSTTGSACSATCAGSTSAGTPSSTGNEGLLDQLAALRWVKEEIAAFGGDPNNVTVFGQSAGAGSIYAMLSMPQTRGLFHKAILQSGTGLFHTPSAANRVCEDILRHVGLASHEAQHLRDLPATELLDVQTRATPRSGGIAYRPVADGKDVPADPLAAIAAGSAGGIPLLVGTNLEEQRFFSRLDPEAERLTDDGLLTRLTDPRANAQAADNAQFDPAEAVAVYRQARAARGEDVTAPALWVAMLSDRRFRVPTMQLAKLQSAHCAGTYAYLFTSVARLERKARRWTRGRSAAGVRDPGRGRRIRRVRGRRDASWGAPGVDAGRLGRLRPYRQPSDAGLARLGAVHRRSPHHDVTRHNDRLGGCTE